MEAQKEEQSASLLYCQCEGLDNQKRCGYPSIKTWGWLIGMRCVTLLSCLCPIPPQYDFGEEKMKNILLLSFLLGCNPVPITYTVQSKGESTYLIEAKIEHTDLKDARAQVF